MRSINVLAIQRISADDRAKIEASDPAIRLIDAGGWFEGEIRETWSDFAASRYLPPGATGSGTREERDRLLARSGSDHWRLAIPARHARQGTAAEMVSPAASGRQQPARQRSVGQRRGGNDLARRGELTADRRICASPASCISRWASTGRRSIAKPVRSTIAPIDRFSYRARPPASSAPAGLEPKSAGSAPRSACGSSAPAVSRSPARPCRKASAKSAGRRLSTGFCRKAISSRYAVNGPRRPPACSTRTASRR